MALARPAGTVTSVEQSVEALMAHLDHLASQSRQVLATAGGLAEAMTAERYLRALSAMYAILQAHELDPDPMRHLEVRAVAYAIGQSTDQLHVLLPGARYDRD